VREFSLIHGKDTVLNVDWLDYKGGLIDNEIKDNGDRELLYKKIESKTERTRGDLMEHGPDIGFSKFKSPGNGMESNNSGSNTGVETPWVGTTKKKTAAVEVSAAINKKNEQIISILASSSTTHFKPGAPMSNMQSLAHQLELLDDLKRHIQSMQSQMETMMQQYGSQVQGLRDAGMMIERHDRLQRQVFEPTDENMRRFIEYLQDRDLAVLAHIHNKVTADLEDELHGGR